MVPAVHQQDNLSAQLSCDSSLGLGLPARSGDLTPEPPNFEAEASKPCSQNPESNTPQNFPACWLSASSC